MNLHDKTIQSPRVTCGSLSGSRKIYSAPEGHADLRVPLREIALTGEPPFHMYDTSGPYTDADATIDVSVGCHHCGRRGSPSATLRASP